MAKSALLLSRYTWEERDRGLSRAEQEERLEQLKAAQPIAYRKSEPESDDFDTYIIAPTSGTRLTVPFLTWQVCRDIRFRQVRKPDRRSQTVRFDFEDTDDCELARIVAIPSLGVLAVEDGTGDGKIGGWSALQRFRAIVGSHTIGKFEAAIAGTPQDLAKAIETWELDQFSFQARPFNPHPSNPGQVLSDMMKADKIGEIRGTALPHEGGHIKPKESGMVQETLGLAAKGYATYGATGRTPSGAKAVIRKQPFSHDRHENLERLRGPQQLRVYIDADDDKKQIKRTVDVLLEFFSPDSIE
jgi:hypothetical protein